MHNRFDNRLIIDTELKTVTPLHIGSGSESFTPSAVQSPLIKNDFGQPFIPGSSIKGVLRSFVESINQDKVPCYMGKQCSRPFNNGEKRKKHLEEIKKQYEEKAEENFAEDLTAKSCMACRLFGSGVLAGKVKISDAVFKSENLLKTEVRTGNKIERDTHTAERTALFGVEVIPAGNVFSLRFIAENLTKSEAEIFAKLVQYFGEGEILLGGKRRSGLGQVWLQNIKVEIVKRRIGSFPERTSIDIGKLDEIPSTILVKMADVFAKEPEVKLDVSKTSK